MNPNRRKTRRLAAVVALATLASCGRKEAPAPPTPAPAPTAAPKPEARRQGDAPPPAMLAVGNAPIDVNAPALTKAERAKVAEMYDADFLLFQDALDALDAFYPEDLHVGPTVPPGAAPAAAQRPAESDDEREMRFLSWRSLSAADRARVERIDGEYRKRPAARRSELERRWIAVSWFPLDEKVGIRRLVSRLADLDPDRGRRLVAQIHRIAVEPVERRGELWRALPFAQTLTGQERTAGERLLIARPL